MSGRPSKASELAKSAYEKSGFSMTAKELSKKYKLSLTTIYRAPWWKEQNKPQGENK